jgi:hypothetical protein
MTWSMSEMIRKKPRFRGVSELCAAGPRPVQWGAPDDLLLLDAKLGLLTLRCFGNVRRECSGICEPGSAGINRGGGEQSAPIRVPGENRRAAAVLMAQHIGSRTTHRRRLCQQDRAERA